MTSSQTNIPELFLHDYTSGGLLAGLTPLTLEDVQAVATLYQGISSEYLDFISMIGIGETKNGLFIHTPYLKTELISTPSAIIYNSQASRRLFGLPPANHAILQNLVCVADTGASWRYCLNTGSGNEVVCLDLAGFIVSQESDNFFSFIQEQVFDFEAE